jgi:hypothetical protein
LASLIAVTNITPTTAGVPVPTATADQVEVAQLVTESEVAPTQSNSDLSIPELIAIHSKEQGVDVKLAQAIAFCESTNRQFIDDNMTPLRGLHNPLDVGIFQINEKYHLEKSQELGFDIYTITGNIDYALWLLKNGGSRHWNWSRPCWSQKINPVA